MKTPTVAPFRAVRYNPKKNSDLSQVVAPPYDVIDNTQRDQLYQKNPNNVVRLILTRDEDGVVLGGDKYEAAKRYLNEWQESEILIRDSKPQIYLYHQTYTLKDGRKFTRKGFIALKKLESFEDGKVKPHEYTFSGPKVDRLNLIKATSTNLSPIFGIFSDASREIEKLLELSTKEALIDIKTEDGNRHQLWAVGDVAVHEKLNELMEPKTILIADGHHRYETALNYRDYLKNTLPPAPSPQGSGEVQNFSDYVMMYFCPMEDEGLIILPTHRVVTAPISVSWKEAKAKLQPLFKIEEFQENEKEKAFAELKKYSENDFAFLISLKNQGLKLLSIPTSSLEKISELSALQKPVRELDVTILHQYLLPHIFKVESGKEYDADKVLYIKDADDALNQVAEGKASAAFILNPTKIKQVEAISQIGERMPQKSTFFYPKLLSGLLFNRIK